MGKQSRIGRSLIAIRRGTFVKSRHPTITIPFLTILTQNRHLSSRNGRRLLARAGHAVKPALVDVPSLHSGTRTERRAAFQQAKRQVKHERRGPLSWKGRVLEIPAGMNVLHSCKQTRPTNR